MIDASGMGTVLSGLRAAWRRLGRADRWALAVLVVLPLAVFALPALLGHSVLLGDDLTQNFPLRVLVGKQIRHGEFPLFDPYIWSGTPLLGGWNAGAAYPLTMLFVILPGTAAWALNLVATWWVAGVGCFVFLRASRLAPVPSFLGAFSFSFAGSMAAQVVHFGLVAGVSWVPVALLAVLRLSELAASANGSAEARRSARRSWLGWTALLAVAGAMNITAGEPRAISDAAVIVGIYALWRAIRLGRNAGPYLTWVAGAVVLAGALGAVQLLPGAAAVSSSQRAASTTYLFTSGSLSNRWLTLMLVPDILGGSGSFGQPTFVGSYNITEVTGYVGLMPLVASFALLGRLRWRRPMPEWFVWELMALAGIVLTLGGNTPLWHLLVRIPFFGGQRLQSRNIVIADMAFAFLLAYWSDSWLSAALERRAARPSQATSPVEESDAQAAGPGPPARSQLSVPAAGTDRRRWDRVLGSLPALLAVATVTVGIAWGAGFLSWLGVSLRAATVDGGLRLWFLPFGVLGLAAAALVMWGRRLSTRRRTYALVTFVVLDLLVFTFMTVVEFEPNLGRSSATTATSASSTTTTTAPQTGPTPGASVPTPPTDLSATAYTGSGRFAIYDPNLFNGRGLNIIGAPDLNAVLGVASLQGYSSIVDGTYASATGSHQATGLGQDILDPRAVGDGTLDQLDTTALFAPRDYFLIDTESDVATPVPAAGERWIAPGAPATWYLGVDLSVRSVVVPDADATRDVGSGLRVGLVGSSGRTSWATALTLDGAHDLRAVFARPIGAVALVARAGGTRAALGSPSLTSEDGTPYVADGQLQAAVVPPRWEFRGLDGSFAVFADRFARPELTLRGPPGATVHAVAGPPYAPSAAAVSSAHGTEVVRSVSDIPGWTATWKPDGRTSITLRVRRVGLVQGVKVPAGSGVLSWVYRPPGWTTGWVLSVCGLAALAITLLMALLTRRRPPHEVDPQA
jgi:hypothetical protein